MKTYPHVNPNDLQNIIWKDAEEFAKKHGLIQNVYKQWGSPTSNEIFNKKDNPTSYLLELAGNRLHRVVTYGIYSEYHYFCIDRQNRVLAWTAAEGIGDYWCPKCGEHEGKYIRIIPVN
ncbi:MAG: hypothetical protein AAB019_02090 [Planctomycetota bacterium]